MAGSAAQLERSQGVVGEHVGQVLHPLTCFAFQPVGGGQVAGGSRGARDLGVCDVADEQMPEAVLALTGHRTRAGGADELLARQLVQRLLDLAGVAAPHFGQCPGPEHLADHGRVLQQALALGREGVEAGGDQRLYRFGHLHSLEVAAVAEQAHELLCIERIAAGPLQERPLGLGRQDRAFQQRRDQAGRLLVGERGEVDGGRVAQPRGPGGALLVQLRPGVTKHEQWHPFGPVGKLLQEGQQRRVGPVQILEHQHRRPIRSQPLEEAPPGHERLLLRRRLRRSTHQRRQPRLQPGPIRIIGRQRPLQLRRRVRRRVGLEDAALRLHDLPQRPERDPLSVRK
jgi:hypothetical protein